MKKWISLVLVVTMLVGTLGLTPAVYANNTGNVSVIPASNIVPSTIVDFDPSIEIVADSVAPNGQAVSASPSTLSFTFNQKVWPVNGRVSVRQIGGLQHINFDVNQFKSTDQLKYEISLPHPLESGASFEVEIQSKTFMSEAKKGLFQGYKWSFTVKGAPQSVKFEPAKGSVVPHSPLALKVSFQEPVQPGAGSIRIRDYNKNSDVVVIKATQFAFAPDPAIPNGMTASYILPQALEQGKSYYVIVDENAIKDKDGSSHFKGVHTPNEWHFETEGAADRARPKVTKLSPNGNSGLSARLEMTFDEPVFQQGGEIVIRTANKPDIKIPVTTGIIGGGTTTISSINVLTFEHGRTYTVEVPEGAFRDKVSLLSEKTTWTFSTHAQDTSAPTVIVTHVPSYGSNETTTTKPIILTFNEPIVYTGKGIQLRRLGNTSNESLRAEVKSERELWIYPTSALQENTVYVVHLEKGAVKDLAGNEYTASASWSFSKEATDRTAPELDEVKMHATSVIRIKYKEALNSTTSVPNSEFTVTVNNESRRVSSVTVSGDTVYVYIDGGVSVGQVVTISYSGRYRMIKDLAGNAVGTFSSRSVENSVSGNLTSIRESYIYGNTLHLYFAESLKEVSSYAKEQFTVMFNNSTVGIDRISNSGTSVSLTLNRSVSNGEIVKVSYNPGRYPIEGTNGIQIGAFSSQFVRNNNDSKAPELSETYVAGNKLTLVYNEALKQNSVPGKSYFSVLVNEISNFVTKVEVKENLVELTLTTAVRSYDKVTVSYVRGTPYLEDLSNNSAQNFSLVSSNNRTDSDAPVLVTTQWKAPAILLTFNKTLEAAQISNSAQFNVRSTNQSYSIRHISVTGQTVAIELLNPPNGVESLSVSYYTGQRPIKSVGGQELKVFSNMNVLMNGTITNISNNTTSTNNTNNNNNNGNKVVGAVNEHHLKVAKNYTFIDPIYELAEDIAQKAQDNTSGGYVVQRYTLDKEKLKKAFDFVVQSNESNKHIIFEVPLTERGARVALPLSAFERAYSMRDGIAFSVKYGDVLYGISINSTMLSQMVRDMQISVSDAMLLFEIEPAGAVQADIQTALSSKNASVIVMPHSVAVYGYSSKSDISKASSLVSLNVEKKLQMRANTSLHANQSTLVIYNTQYRQISHWPTKFKNNGTTTIASATVMQKAIFALTNSKYNFLDVTQKHWARNSITTLAAKFIMTGSSNTHFKPKQAVTRMEFAIAIARALGLEPDSAAVGRFSDVSGDSMNGAMLGAAVKAGVINGFPDGNFRPNANITREQITLMLIRAAQSRDFRMQTASSNELKKMFKDHRAVSKSAAAQIAQAVKAGLIEGVKKDQFQPQANATREQAAVLIVRLLSKLNTVTLVI
ncbi:SwmB domain-containing protein [Paenibacillus sp. 481]|uniref:SwmB domain-containing protein n=1 Tax=Paenibacillus sp. 481 TaxID=2835869 RepID=UPI001E46822B|nr:SwmB domain-containing protein [Paenibacillus sp. 481]UHA75698.1 Ig-like domain-containing protein [Paenibacillus sp. 481]